MSVPAGKPGFASAVVMKSPEAMTLPGTPARRRHKCFDDTHREIIETTVRLISEKGVDAVSMAAVARATGINRETVY